MANGDFHQTETISYAPHKTISFSKDSTFTSHFNDQKGFFNLELCELDRNVPRKLDILSREKITFDRNHTFSEREIVMPTIYGTDAVIYLTLQLTHTLQAPTKIEEERTGLLKRKNSEKGSRVKLTKLLSLMNEYVMCLSPLYYARERFLDYITWKDPRRTLLISLGLSFFIIYGNYLLGLGFLLFTFFGRWMIPQIMDANLTLQEDNEGRMRIYKRNLKSLKVRVVIYNK